MSTPLYRVITPDRTFTTDDAGLCFWFGSEVGRDIAADADACGSIYVGECKVQATCVRVTKGY